MLSGVASTGPTRSHASAAVQSSVSCPHPAVLVARWIPQTPLWNSAAKQGNIIVSNNASAGHKMDSTNTNVEQCCQTGKYFVCFK